MHLCAQENQNVKGKGDPVAQLMSIYQQNNGEALQSKYQRKQYGMIFLDIGLNIQKKGWYRFPRCKGNPKIYYTKSDIHLCFTLDKNCVRNFHST